MGHIIDALYDRAFAEARAAVLAEIGTQVRDEVRAEIQRELENARRTVHAERLRRIQIEVQIETQRLIQEAEAAVARRALSDALALLLRSRFQTIPESVQAEIDAADVPRLQALISRAATAASLNAVFEPVS